jgi:hypothetical protein
MTMQRRNSTRVSFRQVSFAPMAGHEAQIAPVQVERFIARWTSCVYAMRALKLMNVGGTRKLERELHDLVQFSKPEEQRLPFDSLHPPRRFERMLKIGCPDIRKEIRLKTAFGRACNFIPDPLAELPSLIVAPFWRVLDPVHIPSDELRLIQALLEDSRARKPVSDPGMSSWRARGFWLTKFEAGPWEDGVDLHEDAFVCITDALVELHLARNDQNLAWYATALQAVLELCGSTNNWILRRLAEPVGVNEIGLEQYIRWAFGVLRVPSSTENKWRETVERERLDGVELVLKDSSGGVERYEALINFADMEGEPSFGRRGDRLFARFRSALRRAGKSELVKDALSNARAIVNHEGHKISRAQVAEIVAALFGYSSFAALIAEQKDTSQELFLDDAEILVLNRWMGFDRCKQFVASYEVCQKVFEICVEAIRQAAEDYTVFDNFDQLYRKWARREIAMKLECADFIPAELADVLSPARIHNELEPELELWDAEHEWAVEAEGTLHEVDEDGEPVPGGHRFEGRGFLKFRKAGRAGLIYIDYGASGERVHQERSRSMA